MKHLILISLLCITACKAQEYDPFYKIFGQYGGLYEGPNCLASRNTQNMFVVKNGNRIDFILKNIDDKVIDSISIWNKDFMFIENKIMTVGDNNIVYKKSKLTVYTIDWKYIGKKDYQIESDYVSKHLLRGLQGNWSGTDDSNATVSCVLTMHSNGNLVFNFSDIIITVQYLGLKSSGQNFGSNNCDELINNISYRNQTIKLFTPNNIYTLYK